MAEMLFDDRLHFDVIVLICSKMDNDVDLVLQFWQQSLLVGG